MIFNQDNSDIITAIQKDNISETIFEDTTNICLDLNSQEYGLKGYTLTTSNTPVANTYGVCFCFGRTIGTSTWVYQYAIQTNGDSYIRTNINNGGWSAWKGINAIQEGSITTNVLTSGHYNYRLYKNNRTVSFNLDSDNTKVTLTTTGYNTIATLPEGFRPSNTIFFPAIRYLYGGSWEPCLCCITSAGLVQIGGTGDFNYFRIQVSFIQPL